MSYRQFLNVSPMELQRTLSKVSARALQGASGSYRNSAEAIIGMSSRRADSAIVQESFEQVRRQNPGLSLADYFSNGYCPPHITAWLLDAMGADSFVMGTTRETPELVAAWLRSSDQLSHVRAPFDAGFRVGGFLDRTSATEQLALAKALRDPAHDIGTIPMDTPTIKLEAGSEVATIASWTTARQRGLRATAFQLLNFGTALGVSIKLKSSLKETLTQVSPDTLEKALPSLYGPELRLIGWDGILTLATGMPPISAGRLASSTPDFSSRFTANNAFNRNETHARLQLYRRTGDADFLELPQEQLRTLRDSGLTSTDLGRVGDEFDPWGDPFPQMTTGQLLGHAIRDPAAVKIWYSVAELEHDLGQRVSRAVDQLSTVPGLPESLGARLRRATGLTDPANVHLLSPFDHAMTDAFAAFPGLGRIRRDADRFAEIRAQLAFGNRSRMNRYGSVVGQAFREALEAGDAGVGRELVDPDSTGNLLKEALRLTGHKDAERGLNALVGAQPESLEEIVDVLADPQMRKAIDNSTVAPYRGNYETLVTESLETAEKFYPSIGRSGSAKLLQPYRKK
jgi:hypothetical protein